MSSSFKTFKLLPELQRAVDEAGYVTPTPVQIAAIPLLLEGSDLVGIAETGTGKTLAYLLPILQRLGPAAADPRALVICPTRELAIQVAGEAERFGRHLGLRCVLAYGGTSSGDQKKSLAAGCDLVVGTPGRLLDFSSSAWLSLKRVRFLVLDEADRMLDMGFIHDIDAILRRTPMSRQTILMSATIPEPVRRLADRYLLHPETVRTHEGTRVAQGVDHAFYPVKRSAKEALLLEILRRENPSKALIFTATRESTTTLARVLRRHGHAVVSMSSLLSQANRERALTSFRDGGTQLLVATDLAARGLDITDIDLVINFDVPMAAEEYVHRIGRTGRALRAGRAITLVSEHDRRRASEVERLLGQAVREVRVEGFEPPPVSRPQGGPRGGQGRPRRSGRRAPAGTAAPAHRSRSRRFRG